ncbi:MAG: nucleotidyltransferase [Bacteroidia bacterium]
MIAEWNDSIHKFIELCQMHGVKMLMVGGGAVNFHGYQRHSADVDFWIDMASENLKKLIVVFNEMGYEISDFPEKVKNKEQNISVKFSPVSINLELITNFSINKSFDEALKDSELAKVEGKEFLKWNVLSFDDLITSKIKAGRPKDLLDIQELKRLKT